MKQTATNIKATLSADSAVTTITGSRIYWALGKQKEKQAAVVFSVQEIILGASSDSRKWATTIRCYAPDMDQASDLYEAVRNAMKQAGHQFKGGDSGITDDEDREGVAEMIFEL